MGDAVDVESDLIALRRRRSRSATSYSGADESSSASDESSSDESSAEGVTGGASGAGASEAGASRAREDRGKGSKRHERASSTREMAEVLGVGGGGYAAVMPGEAAAPVASDAAAAAAAAAAGGGVGGLQTLDFNLIPTREFGLQMLRMPRWVSCFACGCVVCIQFFCIWLCSMHKDM